MKVLGMGSVISAVKFGLSESGLTRGRAMIEVFGSAVYATADVGKRIFIYTTIIVVVVGVDFKLSEKAWFLFKRSC